MILMSFEQYLRDNPMPTQDVGDTGYVVGCNCERSDNMKPYATLKKELDEVCEELDNNLNMSYKDYEALNKKKVLLLQEIDECPLIYEIWYDDYDGSMSGRSSKHTLEYRFINKDKAYIKLKELNDGCNYGRPYYMKIRELDG